MTTVSPPSQYQSPITETPLLSSDQLAAIQKSFAPTNATAGLGAGGGLLPGIPIDPGAASFINGNFGNALNINNAQAYNTGYLPQEQAGATNLFNDQEGVLTANMLAGLQNNQQANQQRLGQLNTGRQYQLGNLDFVDSLLGGSGGFGGNLLGGMS